METRITFIVLLINIVYVSCKNTFNDLAFPKDFLFSTATASYQVEGAWNLSGKGENIWDRITHTNPKFIEDESNGDIACDSYHKFKEDVQLIKTIGFQMYRFSLSWSRLFPNGHTSKFNEDGVRYYRELIDLLKANGIEPMVTIYHWDLPQPLEDIGGWLNPNIADIFAEYARAVFKLFGNQVKWWITINEPQTIVRGYGSDEVAPALKLYGTGEYISGHNILRAHAKAYRIYDKEFRTSQGGRLTMALAGAYHVPKNPSQSSDVEAAERGNQFGFGWFAHPIFSKTGDYPDVMKALIQNASKAEGRHTSRLPTFTKEEIEELKGSSDYFAANHYSSVLAENGINDWAPRPSINSDSLVKTHLYSGENYQSNCFWMQITPEGFRGLLNWLKKEYNNPEIFITESGYCGNDELQDDRRILYYSEYMKQMLAAMKEDKCKVIGYTAWSLLDNFEWKNGYTKKFGIVHVDFEDPNRKRTMKKSANFFKDLISFNKFSQ